MADLLRQPAVRKGRWLALLSLTAALGCGGRHTTAEDGGEDAGPDADADADHGGGDADRTDADATWPDADEDADWDWDPADTTWLLATNAGSYGFYALESLPGGDFLLRSRLLSIARFDSLGRPVWWTSLDIGGGDVSYGGRGALFAAGYSRASRHSVLVELDMDGGITSQQGIDPSVSGIQALDDGSVIIATTGAEVMRFSPAEGIIWRRRVSSLSPDDRFFGFGLAVTGGTIFVAEPGEGTAPGDYRRGTVLHAMDLEGELLWSELLQGGLAASIAATEEGGVVLVGRADGMWVARLDRDGGLEWSITVGDYFEGYIDDDPDCYPSCNVEEAYDVALGEGGEVMAVGVSSERLPWTGHIDPMVLWLDRDGAVLRSIALISPVSPEESGIGQAAAALSDGGWLVSGYSSSTGLLASLDADGTLDGPCEYVHELEFEPRETPGLSVEPLEVTVDEGTFELVDADPLEPEDERPGIERLCD